MIQQGIKRWVLAITLSLIPAGIFGQQVVRLEYFIDSVPALGQGAPLSLTPGSSVDDSFTINTSGLDVGRHLLLVRAIDSNGIRSHLWKYGFIVDKTQSPSSIEAIEWFIGQDPGVGDGSIISVTPADSVDQNLVVQTDTLPLGDYIISMRAKNDVDIWSHALRKSFKICTQFGPKVVFEPVINRNKVIFLNNSEYADSVRWLFGDGQQSTIAFSPTHEYVPGVYTACLEGINICGADTLCKEIAVPGISHVFPTVHSNDGFCAMDIYGGALDTGFTLLLFRDGVPDIFPRTTNRIDQTNIGALFQLRNEPVGSYHLEVTQHNGRKDTLFDAIELVPNQGHDLWIDMPGTERVVVNRKYRYNLLVGNQGNKTAFGVPLYIKAKPGTHLKAFNVQYQSSIPPATFDSLGDFIYIEDPYVLDSAEVGTFMFPQIRPGEVVKLELELSHPAQGERPMEYFLLPPQYSDVDMDTLFRNPCGMPPCLRCALDILGVVPGIGCVTGIVTFGCDVADAVGGGAPPNPFGMGLSAAATILSCAPIPGASLLNVVGAGLGGAAAVSGAGASTSCGPGGCNPKPKKPKPQNSFVSIDPNIKVGPTGFSSENYIRGDHPMVYSIYFENADTATAPASEVRVVDSIDTTMFDVSSLRFISFGFGDTTLFVLDNASSSSFVRDVDLRPARQTIVRVQGEIDENGVLTTSYISLDPDTLKLVIDPFDGFLPPNVNAPEGEGYIQFMINLKPGYQHLDEMENKASIYFDVNAPIETPIWTNTIDLQPPSSSVNALPDSILDTVFTVSWGGTDPHAGVMDYDVYVIENDTIEYLWKVGISKTSAPFKGEFGHRYKFYSVARDNAGNEEDPPADPVLNPDAETILLSPTAVRDLGDSKQWLAVHPNPATNSAWISWEQSHAANIHLSIIDASGMLAYSVEGFYPSGMHNYKVSLQDLSSGIYVVRVRVDGRPIYTKLVVQQ